MDFAEYKKQLLQDPEFKKAYDDLGPEYEIIRAMIDSSVELQQDSASNSALHPNKTVDI